jgi:transglutaminase-like putative cysteine protease
VVFNEVSKRGLAPYLAGSEVVDLDHPEVAALARKLSGGGLAATAVRCFEFVRDEVSHTLDAGLDGPVTCRASEVLAARTGLCYAKSHLLAALLRADGIPAGLCYQRLRLGGPNGPLGLHGLNALLLPGAGWLRVDARGDKPGVDARFEPPDATLAFQPRLPGEADLAGVWPQPWESVTAFLRSISRFSERRKAEAFPVFP